MNSFPLIKPRRGWLSVAAAAFALLPGNVRGLDKSVCFLQGWCSTATNYFKGVDSSTLLTIPSPTEIRHRQDFLDHPIYTPDPIVARSGFVPLEFAEHLLRSKKDSAIGVKYVKGDAITNMEGALATFVVPVGQIRLLGDIHWMGASKGGVGDLFEGNQYRPVILSASIQPDCEIGCSFPDQCVIMRVISVGKRAVEGNPLRDDFKILSAKEKENDTTRKNYDKEILSHLIYNLTEDHRKPSLNELDEASVFASSGEAEEFIERLIGQHLNPSDILKNVHGRFAVLNGTDVISLEILLKLYIEQLNIELKVLEEGIPQGYVYTISPPSIFAAALGNARLLNRMQAVAFQSIASSMGLKNMKKIAFDDYNDKEMIPLLQQVFPSKACSKNDLYPDGRYSVNERWALVLHNNSDAFGQNIETEPASSLDGVIGSYSDAALVFSRERPKYRFYSTYRLRCGVP